MPPLEEPSMEFASLTEEELIKLVRTELGFGADSTPIRILSPQELEERMEKGLCCTCDELSHSGRHCKNPFKALIIEPEFLIPSTRDSTSDVYMEMEPEEVQECFQISNPIVQEQSETVHTPIDSESHTVLTELERDSNLGALLLSTAKSHKNKSYDEGQMLSSINEEIQRPQFPIMSNHLEAHPLPIIVPLEKTQQNENSKERGASPSSLEVKDPIIAYQVFDKLSKRAVDAWNSLIIAYSRKGYLDEALYLRMMILGLHPRYIDPIGSVFQNGEFMLSLSMYERMKIPPTLLHYEFIEADMGLMMSVDTVDLLKDSIIKVVLMKLGKSVYACQMFDEMLKVDSWDHSTLGTYVNNSYFPSEVITLGEWVKSWIKDHGLESMFVWFDTVNLMRGLFSMKIVVTSGDMFVWIIIIIECQSSIEFCTTALCCQPVGMVSLALSHNCGGFSELPYMLIVQLDATHVKWGVQSIYGNVKISVFAIHALTGNNKFYNEAPKLLNSCASDFVLLMKCLGLFGDEILHTLFDIGLLLSIDGMGRKFSVTFEAIYSGHKQCFMSSDDNTRKMSQLLLYEEALAAISCFTKRKESLLRVIDDVLEHTSDREWILLLLGAKSGLECVPIAALIYSAGSEVLSVKNAIFNGRIMGLIGLAWMLDAVIIMPFLSCCFIPHVIELEVFKILCDKYYHPSNGYIWFYGDNNSKKHPCILNSIGGDIISVKSGVVPCNFYLSHGHGSTNLRAMPGFCGFLEEGSFVLIMGYTRFCFTP